MNRAQRRQQAKAARRTGRAEDSSEDAALQEALAHRAAGRFPQAFAICRAILDRAPDNADALQLTALLSYEIGSQDAAEALARKAISARPRLAEAHDVLGLALVAKGELEAAEAAHRQAVKLQPKSAGILNNLGLVLQRCGDLSDAVAVFRRVTALAPTRTDTLFNLGETLLKKGDWDAALEAVDACLAIAPGNCGALSYRAVALEQLGRGAEAGEILDLDGCIHSLTLPLPMGYDDLDDFNRVLADDLLAHPTLAWEPGGRTTRGGAQTSRLTLDHTPSFSVFEAALRDAVRAYLDTIDVDPQHPHFRQPPRRTEVHMWCTVLNAGGHQLPHFHPAGWLSGVYYVSLPDEIGADDQGGWIEFGRPGYGIQPSTEPRVRLIRPQEGQVVLFPSYAFHRTIPFESESQRISLAFDLRPLA